MNFLKKYPVNPCFYRKIGYNGENSILKENTDESKKWLAVAGITMSTALLLAACGKTEKKADAPTSFSYVYAIDPSSLDYSVTSKVRHQMLSQTL